MDLDKGPFLLKNFDRKIDLAEILTELRRDLFFIKEHQKGFGTLYSYCIANIKQT